MYDVWPLLIIHIAILERRMHARFIQLNLDVVDQT